QNSTQSTPPAQQSGCESEGGLAGRTDILKCEGFETSTWYQSGGWFLDVGDIGNAVDGRRFYRFPLDASMLGTSDITSVGCLSGSCLRIKMYGWQTAQGGGWFGANYIIPGLGGCSHSTLGCVPQQEVWMRYYLKLAPNFDPENYSVNSPPGPGGTG